MKKTVLLLLSFASFLQAHDTVLILDFGSQYTQLIARRVRELGVYCEVHPYDISDDAIRALNPKGIILSGGPCGEPRAPELIFNGAYPVLGICYGMQTMAKQMGGAVTQVDKKEFGHAVIEVTTDTPLLASQSAPVWMSHGDEVTQLPTSFRSIAHSTNNSIAMMAHETQPWYGVQFHPEVSHTKCGTQLLKNFVHSICQCDPTWTSQNIIDESIKSIRQQVKDDQVILAVSGGVDSSVVAALLHRAIGDQLHCIFVDNGLLRLNEVQEVTQIFHQLAIPLTIVDAKKQFLENLKGVSDPEQKRKIIGHEFIAIFEQEAKKIEGARFLGQGTIYPDVIESVKIKSGKTHTIKSHHNVGGLPEKMNLKLIEPVRELFKDEVRTMGRALGLPDKIIDRHPFPGPGLGVRVLGEVKKKYLKPLA